MAIDKDTKELRDNIKRDGLKIFARSTDTKLLALGALFDVLDQLGQLEDNANEIIKEHFAKELDSSVVVGAAMATRFGSRRHEGCSFADLVKDFAVRWPNHV